MAEGTTHAGDQARKGAVVTAFTVSAWTNASGAALHGAGDGLYLQKQAGGTASWLFRFRWQGRRCDMGLGRYNPKGDDGLTLAQARRAADDARAVLRSGRNPIIERRAARVDVAQEAAALEVKVAVAAATFRDVALAHIARHETGWKSAKHAAQWTATLEQYAFPRIGSKAPAAVTVGDLLAVLEPIWAAKPETANRLRGRIEAILDSAKVRGLRVGENVALWKGNLALLLPRRAKVAAVVHHPALNWQDMPRFMASLAKKPGVAARALAFAIMTAARSGEVRGAAWGEIDMAGAVWAVPAARMKGAREHRVPLAPAALAILQDLRAARPDAPDDDMLLFPAPRSRGALSDMTLTKILRDMDATARKAGGSGWRDAAGSVVTAHGFRSAFRDWAGETTAHAREVIEHALAHQLRDKAEAAYARGTLTQKRSALMQDWADFLGSAPSRKVLAVRQRGAS